MTLVQVAPVRVHRCEDPYLKWAREVRLGVSEVDQTQHYHTDEQPPQEAHEVQQAVDVSHKQLEHGHWILHTHTHKLKFNIFRKAL